MSLLSLAVAAWIHGAASVACLGTCALALPIGCCAAANTISAWLAYRAYWLVAGRSSICGELTSEFRLSLLSECVSFHAVPLAVSQYRTLLGAQGHSRTIVGAVRAGERLDLLVFDPGAYGPALRRYGTVGNGGGVPGGRWGVGTPLAMRITARSMALQSHVKCILDTLRHLDLAWGDIMFLFLFAFNFLILELTIFIQEKGF
jgi:hypothetical protein